MIDQNCPGPCTGTLCPPERAQGYRLPALPALPI